MSDGVDFASIQQAHAAIRDHIVATPFLYSRTLSNLLGAEVFLKFENLQFTASFKERGALNKLLSLGPTERAAGVITVSAGNHAQGLAYHAERLGIRATVVMPETAPQVKIARVRELGAEVVLQGATFAEAAAALDALTVQRDMVLVHPFDDPAIICGQGTLAIEMCEAVPDLDMLAMPVGGGGLIAGVAVAARVLRPSLRIVGVQSALFPGMLVALGRCAPLATRDAPIADGIAVPVPASRTVAIVKNLVDDILTVSDNSVEDAIATLLEIEKTLCEGAGAAGIAAIVEHPDTFRGRKIGLVLSGGNIDMNVLSNVLQRALVRRGRVIRLSVTTLDVTGALATMAGIIAAAGGNIRHVAHDRTFSNPNARTATVVFDVETQDASARETLTREFARRGMPIKIIP